jgi:two-component system, sporulation sensor kinase E
MYPQGILQNIELDFISWDQESDGIFGDAYELKKVFMNILKNAIEVMPQGGKVKITQTTTDDNQIRVSIEDQGVGMTSDEMHKIFSPFYTSKDNGTGLGLAHAIQTIEDHGGSIEVESELHQGTTFHILLPLYHLNDMKDKTIPNYTKPDWEVITAN